MEQYPLVRLGQPARIAHVDRRPAVDVAQGEHLALRRRQAVDGGADERERLAGQQS
jgi:hypothetical protein